MNNRSRRHQDRPSVTTRSMISSRLAEPALRVLSSLCAGTLVLLAAPSAFAQGKLDARYEATLAGIPVGKGAWTIDISDDTISAAASGGTSGLLKAFAGGSGTGGAQGRTGAASRDRCAAPRGLRPDDGIDAAGAGVRRSAQPGRLPQWGSDFRRPHAL